MFKLDLLAFRRDDENIISKWLGLLGAPFVSDTDISTNSVTNLIINERVLLEHRRIGIVDKEIPGHQYILNGRESIFFIISYFV